MARRSYELKLGKETFKLRLTLSGQKALLEKNPNTPILAIVVSAVDDPVDMENLLTEALNWDGNENTVKNGEDLYDKMVDAGFCGAKKFMDVVLGIAHNAGLLEESERNKVDRAIRRQLDSTFDALLGNEPTAATLSGDEEGDEGSDRPTQETLDS